MLNLSGTTERCKKIKKRIEMRKTDQGSHKQKKHRAQTKTFLNKNQNEKRKSP